jgi:peptide/nickel transport system substrate-binding protein
MIEMGVGKWRRKEGEFFKLEIVTVDTPENEQAVNEIKQLWEEVGVKISINLLTLAEIRSSIVDERDYEAFFYSYNINSLSDGFTFWHSSQAESGLSNITGYVNEATDKLLEEARQTQDEAVRTAKYKEFEKLLTGDAPAVFLYSPYYIYPQSKSIKGFAVEKILSPKDRFANISEWYIKTGKRLVWE